MTATPEALLITQEGAVRTLTLNRPAALNAFTTPLLVQLREALEAAAADAGVRCVVITGAGRGFSAGQDLSDALIKPPLEPGEQPKDIGHLLDNYYIPLALRLRSMPVPVIAAVNGVAAGAGASLALGCDLVLAAEGASFIQAFSKIGLVPDCGGTWLLPRLVGRAKALELALLGDKLPAAEAARIGLIYRALPDAELAGQAQALAQKLAAMPVKALAATRQALDDALLLDFEAALRNESLLQSRLGFGADYLEGTAAFLQKRKPSFTDR
jgi:2-(1,2-epoxy-1,2-dihydrophenyl)acetyl-CoA isomerase